MRKPNGYNSTAPAKDGCFTAHINQKTTERLREWCAETNTNMTKFVEAAINESLDIREVELYKMMSNEDLIRELLKYKRYARAEQR